MPEDTGEAPINRVEAFYPGISEKINQAADDIRSALEDMYSYPGADERMVDRVSNLGDKLSRVFSVDSRETGLSSAKQEQIGSVLDVTNAALESGMKHLPVYRALEEGQLPGLARGIDLVSKYVGTKNPDGSYTIMGQVNPNQSPPTTEFRPK